MRRLKFLLRPGWLILALLVAAFAYLCFSVLAPWQLGKNISTSHRNNLIADSLNSDPVPVESLIQGAGPKKDDEWRRVTVEGSYIPNSDVLLRLRSNNDAPSYDVLTPVRMKDGRSILVDRGYVRPVEGTRPPTIDAAPTGPVKLSAVIRMSEGVVPGKDPITEDGYRQVYFIDSPTVGSVLGIDLVSGYLQLADDQPGGFNAIALPQLDAGPYLSYGLQWLAFGIMAPLGLGYFVRAELRERRKEREPAATPAPTLESAPPAPVSQEDKLADRYGKRR
ncbi:SURF1 family cytochrome oxidase biogenesis protein [Antrihabitans cavernicola]|uniref:SURF1-like protein n=1 Tax=Antrihabitans cavernicola TaxID=2495913 RepID=A0A5A7SAV3_9NOCA|nr:SURF1 family protein [Spelaeibacter cavernicola]KAA0023056.1 SURF1 family protein [Spelaeibacter cavernicola]